MLHSLVVFGIVLFLNCILVVNSVGIDGREERNRCVLNIVNKNSRRIVLVGEPSVTRNALRKPLYCSYLGIPYARPPIGRLRFEVSVLKSCFIPIAFYKLHNITATSIGSTLWWW